MYGTIFNLKVIPGHENDLINSMKSTSAPPGAVAFLIMKPDNEENDLIAVAVFESKQDYLNNANRPEQHDAFVNMMTHLQEEPTWNDGTYIVSELN